MISRISWGGVLPDENKIQADKGGKRKCLNLKMGAIARQQGRVCGVEQNARSVKALRHVRAVDLHRNLTFPVHRVPHRRDFRVHDVPRRLRHALGGHSSDVAEGFYATGILLYAADPDEGEVPYTYLVLEEEPERIRPASAAVGKLATFDLIAAVDEIGRAAPPRPCSCSSYKVHSSGPCPRVSARSPTAAPSPP